MLGTKYFILGLGMILIGFSYADGVHAWPSVVCMVGGLSFGKGLADALGLGKQS